MNLEGNTACILYDNLEGFNVEIPHQNALRLCDTDTLGDILKLPTHDGRQNRFALISYGEGGGAQLVPCATPGIAHHSDLQLCAALKVQIISTLTQLSLTFRKRRKCHCTQLDRPSTNQSNGVCDVC